MADITTVSSTSAVSTQPELSIHNGNVITTSTQVARFFHKRHADVIRSIKNLELEMSEEERQRNFALTSQQIAGPRGATRQEPMYQLTRDGFMLLAMGFTGKEALRWKLAYIAAFNRMEAELQKPAYDPARIQLAHSLAAQAAAQVTQTVFEAIASGSNSDWRRVRYLLSFGYDRDSQPTIPRVSVLEDGAFAMTLPQLTRAIRTDLMLPNTTLANLAAACIHSMTEHAEAQERKAAQAAKTAAAADKPQLQHTFNAVSV